MTTRILDCDVTIGGTDFSAYVRSINREHFICRPVGTAVISLDPENAPDCNPGAAVSISEMGTKRFAGYVSDSAKERAPAQYEVECQDELKRLLEYQFVDTAIVSAGETVSWWIEYFLNRAGVSSHSVASTSNVVPSGIEFNVESVMEIVRKLCATVGWQVYADQNGTVHVGDFFTLGVTKTISNVTFVADSDDDSWLRNKIVVYGSGNIVSIKTQSISQLGTETRTTALATPYIGTQAEADEAAERLAAYFVTPLDKKEVEMEGGEQAIFLLDTVAASDDYVGGFSGLVTGVESSFTPEGYTTRFFLNERCPQFWGFWEGIDTPEIPATGIVWLSTVSSGVYRYVSWDDTWVAVNQGLSGDALSVREIDVEPSDANIAWIATYDGIYRFSSGTWTKQTLPAPTNNAGDSPAPAYSDLDFVSIDVASNSVATTARHKSLNRGWLYVYMGGSWTSYQLEF